MINNNMKNNRNYNEVKNNYTSKCMNGCKINNNLQFKNYNNSLLKEIAICLIMCFRDWRMSN